MDCVDFASLKWGCTVEPIDIEPQFQPEPCCEEMEALMIISNGVVDSCDTLEEYYQAVEHEDYACLRRKIRDHVCEARNG